MEYYINLCNQKIKYERCNAPLVIVNSELPTSYADYRSTAISYPNLRSWNSYLVFHTNITRRITNVCKLYVHIGGKY